MKPIFGLLAVGLAACSTVTPVPPLPTSAPPPMPPMIAPLAATARPPKPTQLIDTNSIFLWDATHMLSNNVIAQEIWVTRDRPFGILVGQANGLFRLETSRDLVSWQTVITGTATGLSSVVYIDAFGDQSRFFRLR